MMQLNSGGNILQLNSGDLMDLVGSDALSLTISSLAENPAPPAGVYC